jgi:hypothetical protein
MIEMACGVLGWTPQAFYEATHFDFTYALVGYRKKQLQQNPKIWTRRDVREAKARFEKQRIENPDGQIPGKKLPKDVRIRLKENRKLRSGRNN